MERVIFYALQLARIPWQYYAVAVLLFLLLWIGFGKVREGVLVGYLFVFLSITVLTRVPRVYRRNFVPFRTMNGWKPQLVTNILAFIPIGALSGKRFWIGPEFSVCVELMQLIFHRGMCDVDDVINNSIGSLVGTAVIAAFALIRRSCQHTTENS